MKRRNREQRARMRTIQEFRLAKPSQRAMDYLCRKTGLSYRTVLWAYRIVARPKSNRIDLSTFVFDRIEEAEDGSCRMYLRDTGSPQPQWSHCTFTIEPAG